MEIRKKSSMSKRKPSRQAKKEQPDRSKKMSIISMGRPEPILTTGTNYRDIW